MSFFQIQETNVTKGFRFYSLKSRLCLYDGEIFYLFRGESYEEAKEINNTRYTKKICVHKVAKDQEITSDVRKKTYKTFLIKHQRNHARSQKKKDEKLEESLRLFPSHCSSSSFYSFIFLISNTNELSTQLVGLRLHTFQFYLL